MRAARRGLVLFTCVAALSPLLNVHADAAHAATVVRYDADLSVSIPSRSITGRVVLTAVAVDGDAEHLLLDAGDIVVDAVEIDGRPASYSPMPRLIDLPLTPTLRKGQSRTVAVTYHVQPKRAVRFVGDPAQVYTIFTTSEWLPCIDAPGQKATLSLTLRFDSPVVAVGSGDRIVPRDDLPATLFRWNETKPMPTYTFGFAAGQFHRVESLRHGVRLVYLGGVPDADLDRVFRETPDMLDFFESRSGVRYRGDAYTQVLTAGPAEQEVDRFTLLSATYGEDIMKDASDLWLQAHEFAHQWWGNGVTCRSWNDFWLNEGMATFMADAYKEHRFGREAYMTEIDASRKRYERVRDEGRDHALVYENWTSPTAADRTIVYHKGAYVLHLLRAEIGDEPFWRGIRVFTRTYVGKSVTTPDFERAMERSTGRDLSAFFAQWVYAR